MHERKKRQSETVRCILSKAIRILAVIVLMCCVTRVTFANYSGGAGTESNPYQIATKADLLVLSVNTDDYNKCFIMTSDINLAGEIFTTAVIAADTNSAQYGFQGTKFTGVFDGGGYKVENLTIDTAGADNEYLGLFGFLSGSSASVLHLGVRDIDIIGTTDSDYIGGICGFFYGIITNCYTTGSVNGNDSVGGLCGEQNVGGCISVCYSTCSVIGNDNVGGLCGAQASFFSDEGGSLICCYSTGSVSGNDKVGGLCGDSDGNVIACYSTGSVSGNDDVGGLCGFSGGNVIDCYSTGFVSGGEYVGGLCGGQWGNIINCYSISRVIGDWNFGGLYGAEDAYSISNCYFYIWSGPASAFGVPLTALEMQNSSSYAGLDFVGSSIDGVDDTWSISSGHLPKLS